MGFTISRPVAQSPKWSDTGQNFPNECGPWISKAHKRAHSKKTVEAWATRSFPSSKKNKVFSSHHRPSCSTSGDLAAAASMDRWTGVVHVPLSCGGPLFRVAASLVLSPAKTLAVRPKSYSFPLYRHQLFLFSQTLNSLTAPGSTRQCHPLHGRPRPRHRRPGDRAALRRRPHRRGSRWEALRGYQRVGCRRRMFRRAICGVQRTCPIRGLRWRSQRTQPYWLPSCCRRYQHPCARHC